MKEFKAIVTNWDESQFVIEIQGCLNEKTVLPNLIRAKPRVLFFNFENVELINSSGIDIWVKWVKQIISHCFGLKLYFTMCPRIIIDQINNIEGFCPQGTCVESFFLPSKCQKYLDVLIEKKPKVNGGSIQWEQFAIPDKKCEEKECEMSLDVLPNMYFGFMNLIKPSNLLIERYESQLSKVKSQSIKELLKDLIVIDFEREKTFVDINPKKTIFVGDENSVHEIIISMRKNRIQHFVQTSRNDFFYDLFASALMLKSPMDFINNPVPFFVTSFKSETETNETKKKSTYYQFNSTKDKDVILSSVSQFFKDHPKIKNLEARGILIVDELMMNSLFNAPINSQRKYLFKYWDRRKDVSYPKTAKNARIFLSYDEDRLLISCVDPFGSIDEKELFDCLEEVFLSNSKVKSTNERSLGLGCKLMIDNSIGFYVVVRKYEQSLVCCTLPVGTGHIEIDKMPKNLHFCFHY